MARLTSRAAAACVALLCGCYNYYTRPSGDSLAGRRIRLALTDSGSVVLAGRIGPAVESVTGLLVDDTAGTYVMSLSSTQARSGLETDWNGERVTVPHALVARVEERRLSTTKTALLTAGTTALLVAVTSGFLNGGGSNAPGNTPGPPTGPR